MLVRKIKLLNRTGLHARPAGMFAETANRFRCGIKVSNGTREVDARSILSLMLLEVTQDMEITIEADGPDEADAVGALVELIESQFAESRPAQ